MMGITTRADKKKKRKSQTGKTVTDIRRSTPADLPINPMEIAVVYGSHEIFINLRSLFTKFPKPPEIIKSCLKAKPIFTRKMRKTNK